MLKARGKVFSPAGRAWSLPVLFVLLFPGFLPAEEGPAVWTLSSWERILRDSPPRPMKPVLLYAAGNEWESFQIAVRSGKRVRILDLKLGSFKSASGKEIPARTVRLYRAHQLHITRGTYRNEEFKPGWYPDALIPFRNPVTGEKLQGGRFRAVPFELEPEETHTFWIDVYVPPGTPAETYTSQAVVYFEEGISEAVPVTLRVWPFTLPKRAALKTQFGCPASRISSWYRERLKKGKIKSIPDLSGLWEQCALLTTENRINSCPPPDLVRFSLRPDGSFRLSSEQIGGLRRFMAKYHVNALSVPSPRRYFKDPEKQRARIHAYLKSWDRVLSSLGEPDLLCYTYLIDEPNDEKAYEVTRKWGREIRESGSKVKVLVTEQTKPQNPKWGDLYGAVDIWVPLFSLFDPASAKKRQALGEEIWTYTALCQGRPTPWWHIDFPLLNYRIPSWLAWRYDMKGLLYWGGLSYWRAVDDVWTEPDTYPPRPAGGGKKRKRIYNGEGTLLYPAEAAGFTGAVPSMRLKALRDGIEDYDYLVILSGLGRRTVAEALVRSMTPSWYEWSKDPDRYVHVRRKLGCLIRDVMKCRKGAR